MIVSHYFPLRGSSGLDCSFVEYVRSFSFIIVSTCCSMKKRYVSDVDIKSPEVPAVHK